MTVLGEAIDFYHSLLNDETGIQSQAQLTRQLHRRNLFFGERPLCTVLRPRFLTTPQYRRLQQSISEVMPAFSKAYQAALVDPALRAQFMLADWEEEIIHVEAGFSAPSPTARMDCFFTADYTANETENGRGCELCFAEYNAETPAAVAYNDVLSEVFLALPVMGDFQRRYEVHPLPGRQHVLHTLLDAYRQWVSVYGNSGSGAQFPSRPRIAILDWREVPTYSEFMLFQEYFASQDYECVIADPRQLEYRHGQLLVDGITPVHLIYKRVLLSELVLREGNATGSWREHPVIRAVREHAVCMVNPFRCKLLHKKASFAVLSDEANAHLFSPAEQQAVQRYIPWTRCVEERTTVFDGHKIDLLPYLCVHKDNFVLKPNDEYGGKGIVLGWETEQSQWEASLQTALNEPFVVQQRIFIPNEAYPSLVEEHVEVYQRMIDTDPFIWHGGGAALPYVSGCLTRLSTVPLLNVTAGGGSAVPTFVIQRRS
jgi:hypothetical protein